MSFAILGANAALVPNRVRRVAKSVVNTRVSTVTVAGTGKGFGRHTHHKDTHMEIDYKKHIPGYDKMSRPQKYRARKAVKSMINKFEHDRGQQMAVKNTSDFAKKAFAFYQDCVDACEELECVQECKVQWDM